jgi:hypothetical protein
LVDWGLILDQSSPAREPPALAFLQPFLEQPYNERVYTPGWPSLCNFKQGFVRCCHIKSDLLPTADNLVGLIAENSGHFVAEEDPEFFCTTLERFLSA